MFAVEVMGMQYDENISKDIELKYISNIMEKKIFAWNRKERNKIKHQEVWMHTEGVHFRKVVMNLIDTTKQCKQQTLQMKTKITNALSIVLTAEHKRCLWMCTELGKQNSNKHLCPLWPHTGTIQIGTRSNEQMNQGFKFGMTL